jgi:hypothetical protein
MADTLAAPKPSSLERVSPSLAEDLRGCELRVAFRGDSRFAPLRRPRPGAALGVVVHDLAERVARGEFDDVGEQALAGVLTSAWEDAVAEQAAALARAWAPGHPPEPTRWPGYALARVRCLRRLKEQVAERAAHGGRAPAPQAELWVEAPDEPIGGRIDRVERTVAGVEIVDIKSGWTVSDELRPAHRRQLLIYAYLWHARHGEWPVAASIQLLDGTRITLEVDPQEAIAAASEALTLMRGYNARVENGATAEELSQPGAETCLHCDFKAVCSPFFEALSPDWTWYRKALLGEVAGTHGDDQLVVLELVISRSNLAESPSRARVIAVPAQLGAVAGTAVAAVDLLPAQRPTDARYAWDATMRTAPK